MDYPKMEIKQEIDIVDVKLECSEPKSSIVDLYNRIEDGKANIKNWDNSDWICTGKQKRVKVEGKKNKSEIYVDEKHFGNFEKAVAEVTGAELYIKNENCTNITLPSLLNRIVENRGRIKEEVEHELNMDIKEYTNVTELTEELDIKNETDAEAPSAATEDTEEIQPQPVNTKTSRKIFKCYYCKYTTHHICSNSGNFETSTKNVQPTNILAHSDSLSTASTSLQCNAEFRSMVAMDDHILKKHPDCNPIISRKFIIHMPNHSETVQFSIYRHCRHCKATFKSKIALDDHIIKKHPKFISTVSCKVHECTKCTFKTAQKTHLARHFLKHGDLG